MNNHESTPPRREIRHPHPRHTDFPPHNLRNTRVIFKAPGNSGLQLVIKPEELIEGFRPRRIVRLLPESWGVDDLPWEEMLWPSDNRVK